MTGIGFTDRYGGHAPSWLRSCHADCEAMGYVPIFMASGVEASGDVFVDSEASPALIKAWKAAHAKPHENLCDGWHFVKCPDCNGTARVSWLVAIARVPRWLWRGIAFYRFAMQPAVSPLDWTWWQRFKNYANAAFLSDIKALCR